ncbi:MAG: DUF2867 domain-containing protein [Chloroflexota bacterium]|nr:DUF2867 domain-containing protein [Chloroflexota bacterium]
MNVSAGRRVREVPVPLRSLAASAFAVTSYADAYAIDLPPGGAHDIDALTRLLATSAPRWAEHLMWLRDRIVSLIGLRTAPARAPAKNSIVGFQPGDMAGMFRVCARSDDEILLGADDRHLDFRASMLVQRDAARPSAVLTTVVHFNNGLGRAYFFVVRPFHRAIVTSLLRNVARRLEGEQAASPVDISRRHSDVPSA